jgi:precorrin-4 methylase
VLPEFSMTLHLLKNPINAVALELLRSEAPQDSPVAVFLSPTEDPPDLPGITVYQIAESSTENGHRIPYSRLVDLIFEADKVVAW